MDNNVRNVVRKLCFSSMGLSGVQTSLLLYLLATNADWNDYLGFPLESKKRFIESYRKQTGKDLSMHSVYAAVAGLKRAEIIEQTNYQSYYKMTNTWLLQNNN